MFKFLKEKLGKVTKSFSKQVEEEADIEQIEKEIEQEEIKEVPKEEIKEPAKEKEEIISKKEEPKESKTISKEETKEPKEKKKETVSKKEEVKEEISEEPKEKETAKEKPEEKKEEIIKEKESEDEEIKPEELIDIPETKKEEKAEEPKEDIKEEKEPKQEKSFEELKEKKEKRFLGIFKKKKKEEDKPKDTVAQEKEQIQEEPKTKEEVKEAPSEEVDVKEEPKEEKESTEEPKEITKEEKETTEEPKEEKKEETIKEPETISEEKPKKTSIFTKVSDTFTKINLSEEKFENLFWDIEITLLENNVAVEVIELIKTNLKQELCTGKQSRKNIQQIITDSLKESIKEALEIPEVTLEEQIEKKKPFIIAVIGINGAGKTTAIAKLTHRLKSQGKKVVWAAADTFRAAAIQQLEEHANKLDVKMIKHDYNSDPAAVAFDAVKHAKAKDYDVVLIDTAGRMHSNDNLMQELKKLIKVNQPDMKLYIGESITGNDCVEQARIYDQQIGIDAIILTKADIDEKGGAPLSISYVTKKPILFLGTGQEYGDLEPFSKQKILDSLGL